LLQEAGRGRGVRDLPRDFQFFPSCFGAELVHPRGAAAVDFQFFPSCFLAATPGVSRELLPGSSPRAVRGASTFILSILSQLLPRLAGGHKHREPGLRFQFFPSCFLESEIALVLRWLDTFNSFPVASEGEGDPRTGGVDPRPFNSFPVASGYTACLGVLGRLCDFQFFPSCFVEKRGVE
jgi:hypothetical protein